MVTRQIPSGLSSVLFHICKTRFVGWISSLLTYLLGKTFTVAPQSIWNLMGFSLISICAYISRSETLLTVPVISGFEVTQYRNSSSLVSSSSNSTLCVFSLALHWDAKWFFFPHAPQIRPQAAQLVLPLRCFRPQKSHGLSLVFSSLGFRFGLSRPVCFGYLRSGFFGLSIFTLWTSSGSCVV